MGIGDRLKKQSLGIKPTTERVHASSRIGRRQREMEMLGIKCITDEVLWFSSTVHCFSVGQKVSVCVSIQKEQKCSLHLHARYMHVFYHYMTAQALHPLKTATSGG